MQKEDLKNWAADRLKDEIVNLSEKNFNLEWRIKQFEESEGRWKCEIESLRTENEKLSADNAAYSSANSMYKELLENCEQKNKHLFEKAEKLDVENKSLKQRIKDLEDICNAGCFHDIGDIRDKITELQDQHQQDCIRYNDMRTAYLVTLDELARLREQFGVGR